MASLASFVEAGAFGVLNDILALFHSDEGYALPNRFEVVILSPPKLGGGGFENIYFGTERQSDAQSVSLRCESVNLPGRNLNTLTDTNIYGPTREIVDGVTYAEDISMIFQASSGLNERVFFEEWQKQAFNENTWNVGYYNDYVSEVHIYLLDKKDKRRYGIRLVEAFPKTIEATELNQGTNNEIIKTSVSFSFRYWKTLDTTRIGEQPFGDIFIGIPLVGTVERTITANLPKLISKLL